jgi:hypothetical protein
MPGYRAMHGSQAINCLDFRRAVAVSYLKKNATKQNGRPTLQEWFLTFVMIKKIIGSIVGVTKEDVNMKTAIKNH